MARFIIKELAEDAGLSMSQLARRADLSNPTVSALWNNQAERPALNTLDAIAKVLGVKIGDLIDDDGEQPKKEALLVGFSY